MIRPAPRPVRTPARTPDTAIRVLDAAERLVQTRGYNGFSYADIAAELGITKASLHHHFATKAELGRALMRRYAEGFDAALAGIDQADEDAFAKLRRYVKLYEDVLSDDRLCLCGMLAAEYSTLPKPMQDEIRRFFDRNESWLAGVIEDGRRTKALQPGSRALDTARALLGALEGAMLVARPYKDVTRFAAPIRHLLAGLRAPAGAKRLSA